MYDIFILLSRFIFLSIIIYYCYLSIIYILGQRGIVYAKYQNILYKQRALTIIFHLLAFFIITFTPKGETLFKLDNLPVAIGFIVFYIYSIIISKKFFENLCPLIWNIVLLLLDIGLIMLERLNPELANKQLIWSFLGFSASLIIPFLLTIIKQAKKYNIIFYIFGSLLICLPFIIGKEQYGAVNWVSIFGITFQPSEIAKFLFVFYLATTLCKENITLKQMIIPSVISAAYVIVLVIQKDLGGALIYFITYVAMTYVAKGSLLLSAAAIAAASFASFMAYRMFPHIQRRVEAWSNPWSNIDDSGYQVTQSFFAIGTWGIFGSGLTRGYPEYVPFVTTDFIFSAISEEFGSLFGMLLIVLYFIIFAKGVLIALDTSHIFDKLLISGIISMLAFQTFLIIGGVIKLIPITGVTLPFISYGGTSVIASIVMVFLLFTDTSSD